MSLWVAGAVVVAVVIIAATAIVLVAVPVGGTTSRAIEVHEVGPDGRLAITTPYGGGTARLVVHDERGRVYEIALNLRGEHNAPVFTYVPPAVAMVRSHVTARVGALRAGRTITSREQF